MERGGGEEGGAKVVMHDMNFCNFFNLINLPFLIKPSYT